MALYDHYLTIHSLWMSVFYFIYYETQVTLLSLNIGPIKMGFKKEGQDNSSLRK